MNTQLPLSFQAPEYAVFESFIAADNQQLLHSLQDDSERLIYLWGDSGSGKSHLLQAVTQYYLAQNQAAFYIPLADNQELSPQILDGLEAMDLVCLDELDAICGNAQWEEALFHLFNRMRDSDSRLVLAASNSAVNLGIKLPDLRSRLSWGLTYQLKSLDDKGKAAALKQRASQRGLSMNDEVTAYILKHSRRSMHQLMALLDKLDYASLAEQRKLTIPFIKTYLS